MGGVNAALDAAVMLTGQLSHLSSAPGIWTYDGRTSRDVDAPPDLSGAARGGEAVSCILCVLNPDPTPESSGETVVKDLPK